MPSDFSPANGQPYRLHLLRQLAESWGDPDLALLPFLQEGVPTGALSPMPCSRQGPAKPPNASALPELEVCEGNWKTAEEEPESVQSLLDKEICNNWVVATDLTVAEAQRKLPLGVAIGKLNVVFAENKEPRLDSTVCQVNTRCYLPERLSLPMASDLALATQAGDTPGAFLGASIDFKAAHKQIQVRPDEHGLLLFQGRLYHYRVCHFGGRFSAYWWQRTAAPGRGSGNTSLHARTVADRESGGCEAGLRWKGPVWDTLPVPTAANWRASVSGYSAVRVLRKTLFSTTPAMLVCLCLGCDDFANVLPC